MELVNYIATCQSGLEGVLEKELHDLGILETQTGNSMVSFHGDKEDLYKANMALRTALHILLPLKTFKAKDYDLLYFQARKINWHKLFGVDKTIRIDVKGRSRTLTHSQYVIHRVKDGILDTFRKFFEEQRPSVSKDDPDISIVVYLTDSDVTVYLDSSGQPLFKRGYRVEHGEAPIKEDLAAGIILLSDWDQTIDVLDPMCGAGTFLIEAYMIASKTMPNIERRFAFMNWFDYEENIYTTAKNDLLKKRIPVKTKFYGYEKDDKTYRIAQNIIRSLGFEKNIFIEKKDFLSDTKNFNNFLIVSNPPYGKRLDADEDLIAFYKEIGDFLKQKCKSSKASIFTANLEAAKFVGLRTSAKIKLYNGPLEGRLLKFEMY